MIYGIGSMYGSTEEKLSEFIQNNIACIGYKEADAPALHQLLTSINVGDIIFVKSFPPSSGLFIKAVGIVVAPGIFQIPNLGYGRSVKWVWHAKSKDNNVHMGRINDKYDNFRGTTLFQEFGIEVQEKVIDILINPEKY